MNRVKHRAVTPLLAVVMAATTAVGLAACGGDGENADTATTPPSSAIERPLERVDGAAVGRVEGSEMFIAVLDDGTNVRAYLCNGTVDEGTLDLWFDGSWDRSGPVTTLRAAKLALTIGAAVTATPVNCTPRTVSNSPSPPLCHRTRPPDC